MLRSRIMRRTFTAVALASVAMLAACGDSGTEIKGTTYKLALINDTPLPVTFDYGVDGTETIKSGNVTLLAGNRFTFRMAVTEVFEGQTTNFTEGVNGTYVVDGAAHTFTVTHYTYNGQSMAADPGDLAYGTLTGDQLTGDFQGLTMVFNK